MMPNLQDALQHHEAGDLARAAQLYRQILLANPRHADAYHLLGVLMHQIQQPQTAVELIGHAIQLNGSFAPYHNNLGNALLALESRELARASFQRSIALHQSADTYINLATLDLGDGRMREAKSAFEAALRLSPMRLEGLVGLGRIAMMEGKAAIAKRRLKKALSVDPACVAALNAYGELHLEEENYPEAEKYFAKAIECQPANVDAHLNLGNLYMRLKRSALAAESFCRAHQLCPESQGIAVLLGIAYLEEENAEAAKKILLRAVELNQYSAEPHHLLGRALVLCREYQEALSCFQRALTLGIDRDQALNGMSTAYDAMGEYAKAALALEAALELQPENTGYLSNMGLVQARQNDSRAISSFERAIAIDPTDAKIHWAFGEALLSFGDYKRGFVEYEWRWRYPPFRNAHREYDGPLWDGTPLSGKTILIHAEQGLGDTIQFVRFLPHVSRLGGTILLVVQPPLFRLFQQVGCVATCLRQGIDPLPLFDVRCAILSLPALLGTQLHTIPVPFDLSGIIGSSLPHQASDLLRVGLVWAGNPKHKRDNLRSLPLASLLPLRDTPHCRFYSLQKDLPPNDLDTLQTFAMENLLGDCHDLLDTARTIKYLDLIISVDTCVAHLAATLGKNVWLILPEAADWRWGNTGDATPWYPSMTLFRKMPGEKTNLFVERLVCALDETASLKSSSASVAQPELA